MVIFVKLKIFTLILVIQWTSLISQQKAAEDSCYYTQEMVFGQEYYISNPNYPNAYNAETSCTWNLKGAVDSKIYLSCEDIDLPVSPNCSEDKVLISLTGNKDFKDSKNYCGKGSFSVVSEKTALTVGLRTSRNSTVGKFLCIAVLITSKNTSSQNPITSGPAMYNCDCGWQQMSRIVGGEETNMHEFAFMAALLYDGNLRCGANIISDRFLLTVGHCLYDHDPRNMSLLVGYHNIKSDGYTNNTSVYKISAYEIHPEYNPVTKQRDIAIIQTATKINFSISVGPICLPFRYTKIDFAWQQVYLLGWGQLEFTGASPDVLQKVKVRLLSNQQCYYKLGKPIVDDVICAFSDQGKDACQMDSGGPIVWVDPYSRRYQLLGLIAGGIGCGSDLPSINTRVTEYLQWIVQRTAANYCVK